jgi:hypothetical protein
VNRCIWRHGGAPPTLSAHHSTAFDGVEPDLFLLLVLFFGSVITLIPGAFMVSRLGRETATIFITLLSISLALPTLIWGIH